METVNPQKTSNKATKPHPPPFHDFNPPIDYKIDPVPLKPLLPDKPLFSSSDIEKIFDVKKSTVEQWRLKGVGPKFVRLSGSRLIRYRRQDVVDYISALVAVSSTTEADSVV